ILNPIETIDVVHRDEVRDDLLEAEDGSAKASIEGEIGEIVAYLLRIEVKIFVIFLVRLNESGILIVVSKGKAAGDLKHVPVRYPVRDTDLSLVLTIDITLITVGPKPFDNVVIIHDERP